MLLIFILSFFKWNVWSVKRRRLVVVVLSFFVYFSTTPFIYDAVLLNWERQNAVFDVNKFPKESNLKIVVLGSGFNHDSELPALSLLGSSALSRLIEAIRISNHFPKATIITSGHSSTGRTPGADVLMKAAIEMGVPAEKILIQSNPSNTKSEAESIKRFFYSDGDTIVLVTSAIHLPRACKHFRKQGIQVVIPAPCDFYTFKENEYSIINFIPNFSYWSKIQSFNKEAIGLLLTL